MESANVEVDAADHSVGDYSIRLKSADYVKQ